MDTVAETQAPEVEEELFYEAPEPGAHEEEVTVELAAADVQQRAAALVAPQEEVTDVEITQEANAEFSE